MDDAKVNPNPFNLSDLSFEEYRNQEVIQTDDGAFFDALDELVGVVPRANELLEAGRQPMVAGDSAQRLFKVASCPYRCMCWRSVLNGGQIEGEAVMSPD